MKVLSSLIILGAFMQSFAHAQTHYSNFGTSYSTVQSSNGGNNVIISHRMGPNQVQEDYISISIPSIRIDGDYFSCSSLVCPQNTFKCVVTSETVLENESKMRTVVNCLDKNEKTLDEKEYIEENPLPNIKPPFSRHSSVDRDGNISIEDSNGQNVFNSRKMTKEQQEEMANQIHRETERMQQQQRQMQQQLQAQMQKMQEDMQKAFGNGFPFGNQGSPFTQNFPFYSPPTFQFPPQYPTYHYYGPPQYSPYSAPTQHYQEHADSPYSNEISYD